jgi:hypothetical protein
MQCTVLLPGPIWPDPELTDIYRDLPLPNLQWLLGHASRKPCPDSAEHWLARQLQLQTPLPVAQFTATLDGLDHTRNWLRADPVHLQVNMDQLLLVPGSALQISTDDADALIKALNRHFAEDGLEFVAPHPHRWYVQLTQQATVTHTPLDQVAGHNINDFLPQGEDAMRWHQWLNEIQMLLYTHPANDAREQRGLPLIHSVWFWGEGTPQPVRHWPWHHTSGNELLLQALAGAAKASCAPLPAQPAQWLQQTGGSHSLIWLDQLQEAALYGDAYAWREAFKQLDQDWLAALKAQLQSGQIQRLTLIAPGQLIADITSSSRWKFWRRPLPLANLAATLKH